MKKSLVYLFNYAEIKAYLSDITISIIALYGEISPPATIANNLGVKPETIAAPISFLVTGCCPVLAATFQNTILGNTYPFFSNNPRLVIRKPIYYNPKNSALA